MTKDHKADTDIELDAMELRELLDFHQQWMRNPFNRIRFCIACYRQMVMEWLGWRYSPTDHLQDNERHDKESDHAETEADQWRIDEAKDGN